MRADIHGAPHRKRSSVSHTRTATRREGADSYGALSSDVALLTYLTMRLSRGK
jgi:hypothetical protein